MSRKSRRKKPIILSRATPVSPGGALMYVPAGQKQGTLGQTFYGSQAGIPVGQSALFSPGSPLPTQKNVNPAGYPIQFRFPIAVNTFPVDRTMGDNDVPSFQQLRNLAKLYSGVTLCERAWFDMVPRMKLKIELRPEYVAAGANEKDYQAEISYFQAWFESPDKTRDLHSWLRMALREQTQIDELYIYKRKKRGGGLHSLEIIAGDQMKPLLDDWGMVPQPPDYAYQQYPWGIPGQWFRTDEMVHYQETPAADTPYGQSRVERIILMVNQALRKQKKDLVHFTDGNIPQGIMKVPAGATWTPDQIDAFEQSWNALLAGNQSQQVRMRFTQPGMEYEPFEQYVLDPTFDKYILNVAVAAYGMSMQDIAFTEAIHRSTGDSQQNVTYRRTIDPLAIIYAGFFTQAMNNDFDPELHGEMFIASFTGYDEEEDISELAGAYSVLTNAGILGITNAGKMLKLPEDPNAPYIGRVIITPEGPIFLDDMADDKMRNALLQAKIASFQQAPIDKQSGAQDGSTQPQFSAAPPGQSTNKQGTAGKSQVPQLTPEQMQQLEEEKREQEQENDIAVHLKFDQDEPFSPLERTFEGDVWDLEREDLLSRQSEAQFDASTPPDIKAAKVPSQVTGKASYTGQYWLKAQKQQAYIQKQAHAAEAKALRIESEARQAVQTAATHAARAQKQGKASALADLQQARLQAEAAKTLVGLIKTIGTKATLYNALRGRKPSINWSLSEGREASAIADMLCDLLELVNNHASEKDAMSLLTSLEDAIGSHQKAPGMAQSQSLVLDKLASRIEAFTGLSRMVEVALLEGSVLSRAMEELPEAQEVPALSSPREVIQRASSAPDITQMLGTILELLQGQQERAKEPAHPQESTHSRIAELRNQGVHAITWRSQCTCNICTQNNGVTRPLGTPFPSSHLLGPCHDGCPCEMEYHYTENLPENAIDPQARSNEYRRWRQRAIDDVKAMRTIRPFVSDLIPASIHTEITEALAMCRTVGDVREVFLQAREREASFPSDAS